jgi:hypothetical protein
MTMDSAGLDPQGSARWYGGGGDHAVHSQAVHDHDHEHMGSLTGPYFSPYDHAYPGMNHGNKL